MGSEGKGGWGVRGREGGSEGRVGSEGKGGWGVRGREDGE